MRYIPRLERFPLYLHPYADTKAGFFVAAVFEPYEDFLKDVIYGNFFCFQHLLVNIHQHILNLFMNGKNSFI